MKNYSFNKLYLIYIILFMSILVVLNIPPISQDIEYHNFADQRQIIGISNFWNVLSNLPFIFISYFAVSHLLNAGSLVFPTNLFSSYLIFFLSIGSIGLGSAYYHFQPSNETLFWDRLPMTIGFMAFVSIITGEYISEKVALKLLYPLIFTGTLSVLYWFITERSGQGDLRPYVLVQFVPMLILPLILVMFPARYTHTGYIWAMLAAYFLAKIFETFDVQIFSIISLSGHTIKHLFAAIGPYVFFLALKKRMHI